MSSIPSRTISETIIGCEDFDEKIKDALDNLEEATFLTAAQKFKIREIYNFQRKNIDNEKKFLIGLRTRTLRSKGSKVSKGGKSRKHHKKTRKHHK
jgi:hypothetical protein